MRALRTIRLVVATCTYRAAPPQCGATGGRGQYDAVTDSATEIDNPANREHPIPLMDTALVVRAQHGDRDAFALVAGEIADRLLGSARQTLRDLEIAEDATQQAL